MNIDSSYWALPHASIRQPVVGRGMVATSQPLAAQAGLAALRKGGNAVDAALAAAITLTVVEPVSNGVGGDLFALVRPAGAGTQVLALNGSGRAPQAWNPERFAGAENMPMVGWESVTVPGAPLAWKRLSERAGRLPFESLFEDAIRLASDGFPVSPVVAAKWAREGVRLAQQPGFAAQFLPQGRAPAASEIFRPAYLADTLRDIARSGAAEFYQGGLAHAMVQEAARHKAALSLEDLQRAWTDEGWVQPLHLDYRGHRLYQLPPNGQGLTTLIAMGALQHFDAALLGSGQIHGQHLAIEALKLAFVDGYRALSDPQTMVERCEELLDAKRLADLSRRIDPQRALDHGAAVPPWGGTVYVAATDPEGMMVSLIQSTFVGFGSGAVVPGTGIQMHNRGSGFTLEPGHPNQVGGGKRPMHTIIPALATQGDHPWGVFGVTGGPIQPQGQVQLALAMMDGGRNPQAAIDAPRWKLEHKRHSLQLDFEPTYPMAQQQALRAMGHAAGTPGITGSDFGGGYAIVRASGATATATPVWVGGVDPRRDALVACM